MRCVDRVGSRFFTSGESIAQYAVLKVICLDTAGRRIERDSPHALGRNDAEESIFVAGRIVRLVRDARTGDRRQHIVVFIECGKNDVRSRRGIREDDAHMRRESNQTCFVENEFDPLKAIDIEVSIAPRTAIVGWILVIAIHGIDQRWNPVTRRWNPVLTRHTGGIEQFVFEVFEVEITGRSSRRKRTIRELTICRGAQGDNHISTAAHSGKTTTARSA